MHNLNLRRCFNLRMQNYGGFFMKKNKEEKKISISSYLAKFKFGISMYILVYIIAGAGTVMQTILFARAIEQITLSLFVNAITTLAIIAGIVVVKRLCWYLSGIIYQKYANKIMAELNFDLARQAFKLNSKTYADHETGKFVQRIVTDPETVVNKLADLVDLVTDCVTSLVMIVYIATLNIYIALAIVVIVAFCMILERIRRKRNRKNKFDMRRKNDKIYSLTTEIVRSEKDVKALGLEDKLSEISRKYYDEYKKASYNYEVKDMNLWALRNVIIEVFGIMLLILGVYMIDISMLTLASFMIIYSNNGSLSSFVWCIGKIMDIFLEIKVASTRMFSLFDDNEYVCEKFGKTHLENVKGKIEFKNVAYAFVEYEQADSDKFMTQKDLIQLKNKKRKVESVNQIFDKLSFKIEPNTTVAFVGKSGSGKSTILNLMSKMFEVDAGEVLIDGVNINDLDKQTLRNSISLVNQFPYIFDMTIKDNLLLAKKDASDEEIESAIERASLKEFISSLKKGVDTKVGESGIKLSGGQKQRLAIARALLRNSPIIIFDESTSSLDNFAQEDIKKSIDNLKGKSTIVIVAHRLSTIRNVDKIFFLDSGKIEDIGTFDELFENNIKFNNMFYAENLE